MFQDRDDRRRVDEEDGDAEVSGGRTSAENTGGPDAGDGGDGGELETADGEV